MGATLRRYSTVFALSLLLHCAHLLGQTANLNSQYFYNQASFATTGPHPNGVAIADVNGDGREDVIVANGYTQPSISILLGQADGTLGQKTDILLESSPVSVVTGDFNGDGKI